MRFNKPQLKMFVAKAKQLNMNQKTAVCFGFCLLMVLATHAIFIKPLSEKNEALKKEQKQLLDGIDESKLKTQSLRGTVQQSINNPFSSKSRSYKQQEEEVDKALHVFQEELVTPQEMTNILRAMIKENKKLSIVSIEGLPLIDAMPDFQSSSTALQSDEMPKLYKRGVTLTFKGDYFEVIRYLKNIENLPKRLIWGELSYTVNEYPIADVKLTVYTLTSSKEWVGG